MKSNEKYIKKLKKILSKEELAQFRIDRDNLIDLGCSYMELEEFKKSFKIFSIGYRIIGHDPDILNGMGVTLCELGKLKLSKNILLLTLKLFPEDAATLANLAGTLWEEGNRSKSIYYYNKSLKADPQILETHLNLINLHYENGDLFMAYICTLNLLNIFPGNPQALDIRNDIILDMGLSII